MAHFELCPIFRNIDMEPNVETALVAEKKASNNDSLDTVVSDLIRTYVPNRPNASMRDMRIEHTAMIPNDKDIYAYDSEGQYFVLFRAGWYLSLEENHIKEKILADPEAAKLNEAIWASMKNAGINPVKKSGAPSEVKVIT
jgi:hypothetical protein